MPPPRLADPTRLAVAGYGDLDLGAHMFPRITTVHVPRLAMGRMAAQRLLECFQLLARCRR